MLKLFFLLSALVLSASAALAQTYSVRAYGAVADGRTVATAAIQKAVDACTKAGGGTVEVPAGTYLIGTVFLKSNVTLHLDNGAVLKGSPNLTDYHAYTLPQYGQNYYGMLFTENAENVAITGEGTVDGNNQAFYDFTQAKTIDSVTTRYTRQKNNYRHVASGIGDGPVVPKDRPRQMVVFSVCKNVTVSNVSLINSPFWTLHFADCNDVRLTGIRLYSGLLVPNADGVDFTSCSNVTVSDCDIQAGDDALVVVGYDHHFEIPGYRNLRHVSENFVITNCNLQSASSGIRIGFLDQNTVRNVTVSNCNITNSTRGINISLRDEGSLENLTFDNIRIETKLRTGDWWGNGEPIHISAIRGNADKSVKMGRIKNVRFNNITCRGENGILLYGTAESPLEDVEFHNLTFDFTDSPLNGVAGGNVDLRGNLDPKFGLFARDIPGLLAEHINGLTVDNFKLNWVGTKASFLSNGLEVNHFTNLRIRDFQGAGAPGNAKAQPILLHDGTGAVVDGKVRKAK
ncbi:glycosyl hydrolase family 28 protein [Hymenobacter sp. H14-R3]|uniref:glycoside hydrolase family 28 protein n=1 Tax=Hymenobacter sp. H14-R3 TaxID=3046308 RepID=UPI0024BAE200|nr:glycosyl hydrolase family 28 protein [Hymenobacter sp. H14-R3]MDJ0367023.1 glycosyl hydrolase family 28 protein [Hymenobacter sp. H14-R3]